MTTLRIRPSAGTNEFATAMMSVARMLSQSMFTAAKRAEMSPVGTSLSSPASSVCSSSSTSSSSSLELSSDEDSSPPSLMGSKPSCCTLCISFLTALSRFLLAGRSSSSSSPSSSSPSTRPRGQTMLRPPLPSDGSVSNSRENRGSSLVLVCFFEGSLNLGSVSKFANRESSVVGALDFAPFTGIVCRFGRGIVKFACPWRRRAVAQR